MKKLRIVLDKIQTCIELQSGATESQLKDLWNDISSIITESETKTADMPDMQIHLIDPASPISFHDIVAAINYLYNEVIKLKK